MYRGPVGDQTAQYHRFASLHDFAQEILPGQVAADDLGWREGHGWP